MALSSATTATRNVLSGIKNGLRQMRCHVERVLNPPMTGLESPSRIDSHGDIEGFYGMCQRADGDAVDARLGHLADAVERDSPRRLEGDLSVDALARLPHRRRSHVV